MFKRKFKLRHGKQEQTQPADKLPNVELRSHVRLSFAENLEILNASLILAVAADNNPLGAKVSIEIVSTPCILNVFVRGQARSGPRHPLSAVLELKLRNSWTPATVSLVSV